MLRGSAAVVEELKPVSHAFRIDGRDHCASASDDIAAGWRSAYTNGTRLLPLYRDAAPVVASAVSIRSAIVFGPFRLLPDERLLLCGGEPVRLGGRAFDLLLALADEAGIVVGKAELMAKVWPCLFVGEGNLKVQVAALRRALGDGRHGRRYIASVPGRGYCFVAPVRRPHDNQTPAQSEEAKMASIQSIRSEGSGKAVELLNRQRLAADDLRRRVEQAQLTIRTRQTPIREVLDQIIDVVESYSDRISRRGTDLGASGFRVPPGCGLAMLKDVALPGETQMADLAAALAEFADSGRAAAAEATAFGDADTAAVLTEVSRGIDYHHWLLESHLDRSVTIPRCDARRLAAYLATLRPQRTPAERRLRH